MPVQPLKVWCKLMETHSFQSPAEIKRIFGTDVDFLPENVVVFDIGGNKYRISANVRYRIGRIFIREVMTPS